MTTFSDGDVVFDTPVRSTTLIAQIHLPVLSYYQGFGLFGHSANITVSLPYGVGNFSGKVVGTQQSMVH